MDATKYTNNLRKHYQSFFGIKGEKVALCTGPIHKLHPDFYILELAPSAEHSMWTYATVGMSLDRTDDNLIELFTYSKNKDHSRVELLTVNASFHRNYEALNLNHTVVIGQLSDHKCTCDHGLISLPYIEGEDLEILNHEGKEIHCYWYLPITQKERNYKIKHGCEALEQIFEEKQFNYLDTNRESVV